MIHGFVVNTGPYATSDSPTFTGPTHFTGDATVDGELDVVGDVTEQGRSVAGLPRGYVGGASIWFNITTPNTGAETYFLQVPFTAVNGRRYRLLAHSGFLRSDNVADFTIIRVRVDDPATGTVIYSETIATPAAFAAQPWSLPLVIRGSSSTAATTTTNAWPTVAFGARSLYLTMTKGSGTGNTATMIAGANSIADLQDIGT